MMEKSKMKWTRELIAIFTVVALVMNLGMTVCASAIDTVTGKTKSQQIERLHQELNDLAEEKYQIQRQKESSVAAKKESRLCEIVKRRRIFTKNWRRWVSKFLIRRTRAIWMTLPA